MNRDQRRTMEKALKKLNKKLKMGLTKEQISNYVKFKDNQYNGNYFNEGDKVKIDCEGIMSRVDYDKRVDNYRKFIEENKDTVFTVEYDEKYREKPWLVCLKEDNTEPKWLFTTSDLILFKEKKENI